MINEYIKGLRKYAVFSGRASRKEFWSFWLIEVLILIVLAFIDVAAGTVEIDPGKRMLGPITYGYLFLTLVPFLAVGARRAHDSGLHAWHAFGYSWFRHMLKEGDPGTNKYGQPPLD